MCLQMLLYDAFTASVVVLVHSIPDSQNTDAVLDLAQLDELRGLCEAFPSGASCPMGQSSARRLRRLWMG
jgi:hypothetical protein